MTIPTANRLRNSTQVLLTADSQAHKPRPVGGGAICGPIDMRRTRRVSLASAAVYAKPIWCPACWGKAAPW